MARRSGTSFGRRQGRLDSTLTAAEVDHGDFGGLANADIARDHPRAALDRAVDKYRWRFPNGESYADADVRAGRALDIIARTSRRPVTVSHEMVGKVLLCSLLGLTPRRGACATPTQQCGLRSGRLAC